MKPPVNSCKPCMKAAKSLADEGVTIRRVRAVVSPTGKSHWRALDGYTFCGKQAREWK